MGLAAPAGILPYAGKFNGCGWHGPDYFGGSRPDGNSPGGPVPVNRRGSKLWPGQSLDGTLGFLNAPSGTRDDAGAVAGSAAAGHEPGLVLALCLYRRRVGLFRDGAGH